MIGWLILGLPVAAYDPLKMPQFVWYYRGDARVVRAMAGGLIGGGLLLGGLIYALWARGAPLHGAARFAREGELKRHGFRRSEEHTSELQSLMRISYAVFCLNKKKKKHNRKELIQMTSSNCRISHN